VKLETVQASKDHLIVNVREDGLQAIVIYELPPAGTPVESLPEGQKIKFPEPTYSLEDESSQFNTHLFRYGYSSLRTPQSVYDYDMNTGKAVLKKLKPVSAMDLSSCFGSFGMFLTFHRTATLVTSCTVDHGNYKRQQ
jgi:oligopeptidase B